MKCVLRPTVQSLNNSKSLLLEPPLVPKMSKIDALLNMVDSINTRSDRLCAEVASSTTLISQIIDLNSLITAADSEIDTMTKLVARNNLFLSEFQVLYERSFLFEANMHLNETYTNETLFDNLFCEFDYLWQKFDLANRLRAPKSPPREPHVSPVANLGLKNMLSISNLNLKPLRCKDIKVEKQKSRYRLSGAYTLNPLNPVREVSSSSAETKCSNLMDTVDEVSSLCSASSSVKDTFLESASVAPSLDSDPFNMDEAEVSDFESDSPQKFEDFDNFHHFLRRSRVDIRECFPEPLKLKSRASSIFELPLPEPAKYHNPADIISSLSRLLPSQPTTEAIYSQGIDTSAKFKEHSTKLLSHVPEVVTPTKKHNVGLFKLMNSPLGTPRGLDTHAASATNSLPSRRSSVDFLSLAINFLSMVSSTTPQKSQCLDAVPGALVKSKHNSPPEKIKKLKKDIKNPIAAANEIMSKRRPPTEQSRSQLSVGHNKPKAYRNVPVVNPPRRMSQSLLRSALSESLLF